MKTTLRLLALAALALSIPACSTSHKADCCASGGACTADTAQMHTAKKSAN